MLPGAIDDRPTTVTLIEALKARYTSQNLHSAAEKHRIAKEFARIFFLSAIPASLFDPRFGLWLVLLAGESKLISLYYDNEFHQSVKNKLHEYPLVENIVTSTTSFISSSAQSALRRFGLSQSFEEQAKKLLDTQPTVAQEVLNRHVKKQN